MYLLEIFLTDKKFRPSILDSNVLDSTSSPYSSFYFMSRKTDPLRHGLCHILSCHKDLLLLLAMNDDPSCFPPQSRIEYVHPAWMLMCAQMLKDTNVWAGSFAHYAQDMVAEFKKKHFLSCSRFNFFNYS